MRAWPPRPLFAGCGCWLLAVDRDAAAVGSLVDATGVGCRLDLEAGTWPLASERLTRSSSRTTSIGRPSPPPLR
jgi:hypothetical protein